MIGQRKIQEQLNNLIDNNKFPRFVILVGKKGSGKKLLVNTIARRLTTFQIVIDDLGVTSIRDTITMAYKQRDKCCYILPDIDTMSIGAKNALLKVTEEPPNNAYFIMTLEDINNTLPTIKSRAVVFNMDLYSRDEISQFYDREFPKGTKEEKQLVMELCDTIGEVIQFVAQHPIDFVDYVKLVFDNITEVSGANSFKIASKVAIKTTEQDTFDGYDLAMFWKCFIRHCWKNKQIDWLKITSKYLQDLRIKGINKQMLVDMWILNIRKAG